MNIPEPIMQHVKENNLNENWWKKTCDYICKPNLYALVFDFKATLEDGTEILIPKGFQFDGASIPFFLRPFATAFGPLVRAGLIHDFIYKYNYLLNFAREKTFAEAGQKFADDTFRSVIKQTTGLSWLAGVAWAALRMFGSFAFNKHRKNDT